MATQRSQKVVRTSAKPWRALTGLLVVIIVMLLAILGGAAFSPGHWRQHFKVQLGLDLSSGTEATLTAQPLHGKTISQSYMKEAISIMLARVNGAGFSGAQVQQQGTNTIVVTVPGKGSQAVLNLVGTTAQLLFRQVLLVGPPGAKATKTSSSSSSSSSSTSTPSPSTSPGATSTPGSSSTKAASTPSPSPNPSTSAHETGLGAARAGMSSRTQLLALAKPKAGSSSSPSPSNSASGSSSPSPSSSASGASSPSPSPSPTSTAPAPNSEVSGDVSMVNASTLKLFNKLDCSSLKTWKKSVGYSPKIYDTASKQTVACADPSSGYPTGYKFVLAPAQVLGKWVTSAQAGVANANQSLSDKWQVNLSLNHQGATAFGKVTSAMASKYYQGTSTNNVLDDLAIVLDGVIVSAPQIQGSIPGGQAQITYFDQAEAQNLAQELNYGALPVTLSKQDVESITASLGRDQLDAGLLAAAIGLGLVVIYCFIYYRGLGLVSVSSLIVASVLSYLTVVLLSKYAKNGFSLSLASIAGLIVAIGITADSFVVFFERLRDEVREGKSLRPAVEGGWRRARRTILVSDTVSFLCALLLWYFSVSDVKGFAFTLGLTTVIDVVVVFLFTKPMITLLARTRFFNSGRPMSGLDPVRLGARTPWRSGVSRTSSRVAKEA